MQVKRAGLKLGPHEFGSCLECQLSLGFSKCFTFRKSDHYRGKVVGAQEITGKRGDGGGGATRMESWRRRVGW